MGKRYVKHMEWKSKSWLEKEYIEKQKSVREIAKECGVAVRTIAYWLEKFDIKTRDISKSLEVKYRR